MEYIDGTPLSAWIQMFQPLPGGVVLHLASEICNGLIELHAHNIWHRDVKPANIMVTPALVAKLMDFGVVRPAPDSEDEALTSSHEFLGTVRNAAPEWLFGEQYDGRADLYSLGTTFYALLHGGEIFAEERHYQRLVLRRGQDDPAIDEEMCSRDEICRSVAALAQELMARDKAARPATAEDVQARLIAIGNQFAQKPLDPLYGYVAAALTDLPKDRKNHVGLLSNMVAEVARDHGIFVYQPLRATDPLEHPDVDDTVVYLTDRKRVAEADIVFALLDDPSFGPGLELEIAATYGKPTIAIAHKDATISRMVTGSPTNLLETLRYRTATDLKPKLSQALRNNRDGIRERAQLARHPVDLGLGRGLIALRHRAGYETSADFASAFHLAPRFIEAVESGQYENVGASMLAYICACLAVDLDELPNAFSLRTGSSAAEIEVSIQNLERLACKENIPASEYFSLRDELLKEQAASGSSVVVKDPEWRRRRRAAEQRRLDAVVLEARPDDSPPRLL
jgi:transcriptional regulator with XRE-family HTH domain